MSPKDNDNQMLSIHNFIMWRDIMIDKATASWGLRGNLFLTGIAWKRDRVTAVDYMPYEEIGRNGRVIDPYMPADFRRLRETMQKDYNRDIKADVHTNCQFFVFIESKITTDSLIIIRSHPEYIGARTVFSIQLLYDIIIETHLTKVGGLNDALEAENRRCKRLLYQNAKQDPNDTVLTYLKHFLDIITIMKIVGIPDIKEDEMAIHFMHGLCSNHKEFKTSMHIDIVMDRGIPQTPYAMAMLATNFKVKEPPTIIKKPTSSEDAMMLRHKTVKPRKVATKKSLIPFELQYTQKMAKMLCHSCG